MTVARDPLAVLRELGDPEELARREAPAGVRLRVNAHVHLPPNFSAFDSVGQALDFAVAQGVGVLGASNYYDYSVYDSFSELANSVGVFPLFGLEVICLIDDLVRSGVKINDPGNPGKMYLCGKGMSRFSPMSGVASGLLQTVRHHDSARIAAVIERLADLFAARGLETGVSETSIKAAIAQRYAMAGEAVYLQERHVAQAFQEAVFARVGPDGRAEALRPVLGIDLGAQAGNAVAVQNAIRGQLMKAGKPGYVDETFVSFEHAFDLILALGGVPCYPILADGASPICPYEASIEHLVQDLAARHIYCAELIPNRNSPDVLSAYARGLRSAGIFVLAGTEHNSSEMLPMEPRCTGGSSIPEPIQEIFWEGACVVAAHQFLTAHGQVGYVSADAAPNIAYRPGNDRIEVFARLGASVISEYGRHTTARL